MLRAQDRCEGLLELIDQKQYFEIHAARQSGKTTLLQELTERGIPAIMRVLATQIRFSPQLQGRSFAAQLDYADFNTVMREGLSLLCRDLEKPLVLFFDETDCLCNGTLIAFLRQLRDGYVNRRSIPFLHSAALVGMRNIRDYKSRIRGDEDTLGTASPFKIVKRALTLRNFTRDEIAALYAQHSRETGQGFPSEVVQAVYDATQGQPWLVNAIACEIVETLLHNDPTLPILPAYVEQAVELIIHQRRTHLDSLMKRLTEERVQRIAEPVILGDQVTYGMYDDDYRYVLDLGLLSESEQGQIIPSNRIYGEVMIRTLNSRAQMAMRQQQSPPELPAYLSQGRVDMTRLLSDFQVFWRANSAIWQERFEYKEAAPHLILQAFLQRVVNGGGRITREMAGGRKRLDLCVEYDGRRHPIELKICDDAQTETEGNVQLAEYMDTLGCTEGWLLLFDRRPAIAWDKKLFWRTAESAGKTIYIVGC